MKLNLRIINDALTIYTQYANHNCTEVAFEKKLVQQKLQTQIDLEKRRIDAIKEVAKAYASSQPHIYYKQIVKY